MPLPWGSGLFPAGALFGLAGGIAGGIIGAFIGRALLPVARPRQATPRGLAVGAWAVVVIGLALPMRPSLEHDRATIAVGPVHDGRATVQVRFDPPDAVDHARWAHVLAWQGAKHGDGGLELIGLRRIGRGRWVTEHPVPVAGTWKTLLRVHTGSSMAAAPIFLPADAGIPAAQVRARSGPVALVREKSILQREATGGSPGMERVAYAVLAAIGAIWLAAMGWGLRRLDPVVAPRPVPRSLATRSDGLTV